VSYTYDRCCTAQEQLEPPNDMVEQKPAVWVALTVANHNTAFLSLRTALCKEVELDDAIADFDGDGSVVVRMFCGKCCHDNLCVVADVKDVTSGKVGLQEKNENKKY